MNRSPELLITEDGSHTLYLPGLDEHYHSVHGAVGESTHVYIKAGFNQCDKADIHVLELGFGTGLNALLTMEEAGKRQVNVRYTSLEKFPLPESIYQKLNYSPQIQALHTCVWEEPATISPFFTLQKIQTDFNDYSFPGFYDVVYYDAFAPDKQAEVWNQDLFDRLFFSMNAGGIITTYCAKGAIRRMIQQTGFKVERIEGPAGKREMLRARKS